MSLKIPGLIWANGRMNVVRPYNGFAANPCVDESDERLAQWREDEETANLRAELARKGLTDAEAKSVHVSQVLAQTLRRIAIESGEYEDEFALKEPAKARIARNGMEDAREHDQRPKAGVRHLSEKELRQRLLAIGQAVEMAWDIARERPPGLSVARIELIHDTLMGKPSKTRGRFTPPVVHAFKKTSEHPTGYIQRTPPWHVARDVMERYCDTVHQTIEDRTRPTAAVAALAHGVLHHAHPYVDGNSRLSRAMITYVYAARGELPPVLGEDRQEEYENARIAGLKAKGKTATHARLADLIDSAWRETAVEASSELWNEMRKAGGARTAEQQVNALVVAAKRTQSRNPPGPGTPPRKPRRKSKGRER